AFAERFLFGKQESCRLALILARDNVPQAAFLPLSNCLKQTGDTQRARINFIRGLLLLSTGKPCQAISNFKKAETGLEQGLEGYRLLNLAQALTRCSNPKEAAQVFLKTCNHRMTRTDNGRAKIGLVHALLASGLPAKALEYINETTRPWPKGYRDFVTGLALSNQGDLTGAASSFKSAIRTAMKNTLSIKPGGFVFEALHDLNELNSNGVSNAALGEKDKLKLLDAFLDAHLPFQVEHEISLIKKVSPNRTCKFLYIKARLAFVQRRFDRAAKLFDRLASKPKCSNSAPDAGRWMAKSLAYSGNFRKALEVNALVWNKFPGKLQGKRALYFQAYLSLILKKYEDAARLFGKYASLSRAPGKNKAKWYRTWSLIKARKIKTALKGLDNSRIAGAEKQTAVYWKAHLLQAVNETRALSIYKKILKHSFGTYYYFLSASSLIRLGATQTHNELDAFDKKSQTSGLKLQDVLHDMSPKMRNILNETTILSSHGLFKEAAEKLSATGGMAGFSKTETIFFIRLIETLGFPDKAFRLAKKAAGRIFKGMDSMLLQAIFPRPFANDISLISKNYNIDPLFLYAVMRQESAFNPAAISKAGAIGLMQLMPETGKAMAGFRKIPAFSPNRLLDVNTSLDFSAWYLSRLLQKYRGNIALAAAAYNAGEEKLDEWIDRFGPGPIKVFIEDIPFDETRHYTKAVLAGYSMYRLLYDRKTNFTDILGLFDASVEKNYTKEKALPLE
ncbi:MAG: lytic transglycosylase domain-containing protein, partial [Deltaproteobacteria bacterium]|nr:lytic transglycosylase domain-containing protein [Deltaproteobacteria bacterium]